MTSLELAVWQHLQNRLIQTNQTGDTCTVILAPLVFLALYNDKESNSEQYILDCLLSGSSHQPLQQDSEILS